MAKNNLPSPPHTPEIARALPPATIEQLVSNQTKELELRAQELAFQKQQDDHGFQFSKAALDAQLQDRKLQREHNHTMQRSQYVLITLLGVLISGVIIVALWLNKEAIATEVIKAVAYLAAGGFGGFGLGRKTTKQPSTPPASPTK